MSTNVMAPADLERMLQERVARARARTDRRHAMGREPRIQRIKRTARQWFAPLIVAAGLLGLSAVSVVGANLVSDFRQCANNETNGDVTGLGNCHWISSIIQSSNSTYFEGMSVPQRTILTNIPETDSDVHTLTFDHDNTKGGIHAYDWLTSYDQAVAAAADSGITLDLNPCGPEIGPPNDLDDTCEDLRDGLNFFVVSVPDDPFISKDGSTQTRIDAYEGTYGDRTITIYGNAPITSASLSLVHDPAANGSDTADSKISYTLTWTSESTEILVEMAGHLAKSGTSAVGWGVGLGSANISGGPYHFNLRQLDGASLGAQDNQIKGADIQVAPGSIVIVKDAIPDGPTDFDFTTTGTGLSDFMLDDDADPTLSNSKTFTGLAPGQFTVTETAEAGFDLTDLDCDDDASATPSTVLGAVATIKVDPGETVTCTFENTQEGSVVIVKDTIPNGPTDFDFSATGGLSPNTFELDDDADGTLSNTRTYLNVDPGTYTVTEAAEAGFDLTDLDCDDDASATPSTVLGAVATIKVDPGETVTCTFENTERGMVVVNKTTAGVVDPLHQWSFTLTGPDVIGGPDVTTNDTSDAVTGVVDFGGRKLIAGETYTLCEVNIPAGWTTVWSLGGNPVVPYNPDALPGDLTPEDLGTRCYDFTVGAGLTATFAINNVPPPGGDQRTIGYWKNWNECTKGNQAAVAERNGGAAEGFFLLEDVLPLTLGSYDVTTCQQAVKILSKQDQSGKNRANDAAYALAAQLLAAKANLEAGAGECGITATIIAADLLLTNIGFDGSGPYLAPKPSNPLRATALSLAATLDDYNNGLLCP